jgi:hypothetical protein
LTSSFKGIPLTVISPELCSSRPFIVLIKVDLPEPEGPKTTTTSPSYIFAVIPFKASKSPNNFVTPLTSTEIFFLDTFFFISHLLIS